MTCIVGFVSGQEVHLGCDSLASYCNHEVIRRNPKIFKKDNMIFGFTSSFRMGQVLQYKLAIPTFNGSTKDVFKYMCTEFIDSVIECFECNKTESGTFLVGFKGQLFKIESDFNVAQSIDNFDACGCGDIAALSAMDALLKYNSSIKSDELLIKALKTVAKYVPGVSAPFHFLSL